MNKIKSKETQLNCIKNHLLVSGSITSLQAFENYGVTRLSAIIFKLRKSGYDISSIRMQTTNRYGNNTNYVKYVLKGFEF